MIRFSSANKVVNGTPTTLRSLAARYHGVRALNMNRAFSKVFISEEGLEFGIIRKATPPFPIELGGGKVLAEDESGNYFIEVNETIYFWDHETSKTEFLASSLDKFISGCAQPEAVVLNPDQVESVWVDPEFAKQFGIKPKS